jgi:hypothetical protein
MARWATPDVGHPISEMLCSYGEWRFGNHRIDAKIYPDYGFSYILPQDAIWRGLAFPFASLFQDCPAARCEDTG